MVITLAEQQGRVSNAVRYLPADEVWFACCGPDPTLLSELQRVTPCSLILCVECCEGVLSFGDVPESRAPAIVGFLGLVPLCHCTDISEVESTVETALRLGTMAPP